LVERPDRKLRTLNRGISGDTLAQLEARWQADCLDLKPDVLSILVGANDYGIWREQKAVSIESLTADFEKRYVKLLRRTREALPSVGIVLLEPFLLRAGKVEGNWLPNFNVFRRSVARVAATTNSNFVPFQAIFDVAVKIAPADRWASDGVHPTHDGATLMAGEWLRSVRG
jgi:lysophospholipase L1-like esterase